MLRDPGLVTFVALLSCGGCTLWEKQGATKHDLERDSTHCTTESYSKFPLATRTVMTSSGVPASSLTTCYRYRNQTECTSGPGYQVAYTADANLVARYYTYESCLLELGWHNR